MSMRGQSAPRLGRTAGRRPDPPAVLPHRRRPLRAGFAAIAAVAVVAPGTSLSASAVDGPRVAAAVSVERAADERVEALSAVEARVTEQQVQQALDSRAASLSLTARQIRAQSARLAEAGRFFRPTAGAIGSRFGPRFHPILHYTRLHAGLDIGGACGQPIWAAAAGTVVAASQGGGSGLNVRIDHGTISGKKVETVSMHMSSFSVSKGDKVLRGQVIGKVGDTGLSTACHLHFSTYENGTSVDPLKYLDE